MISSPSPLVKNGDDADVATPETASPNHSGSGRESTDESTVGADNNNAERTAGYGDEQQKPPSTEPESKKGKTGTDSPTQEDVLEALKRCAIVAAERRRMHEEQERKLAEKERELEQKLATSYGPFHETPAFSRSGKRQPRASRRRRPSGKLGQPVPPLSQQQQPFFQPPPQNQRSINSYCRELVEDLNALDRMFGYGTVGFIPLQMRCLISEIIQRVEGCLGREQSQRYIRPLRDALGDVPLLETISQPPLRVPPSMLRRQRESPSKSSPKQQTSAAKTTSGSSPKSGASSPPQQQHSPTSDPNVVTASADVKSEVKPSSSPRERAALNQSTATTGSHQPTEKRQTPSPNQKSSKQPSSAGKKSTSSGGGARSARKNMPPILEAKVSSPLRVVYLDGMPKDVGFERRNSPQQSNGVWKSAKIYIPDVSGYSFIGRILGPRGISVRRLEAETGCKILIRGQGSIKDEQREKYLMNRSGWAHLHDQLHVLISANDESADRCRERLERGVGAIQRLLTPQYDEYKRQQLMQLAILNGTFRP